MSYARQSDDDSDVYVFSDGERYHCCHCRLGPDVAVEGPQEMLLHLAEHVEAGQMVPEYCVLRLAQDAGCGSHRSLLEWLQDTLAESEPKTEA